MTIISIPLCPLRWYTPPLCSKIGPNLPTWKIERPCICITVNNYIYTGIATTSTSWLPRSTRGQHGFTAAPPPARAITAYMPTHQPRNAGLTGSIWIDVARSHLW